MESQPASVAAADGLPYDQKQMAHDKLGAPMGGSFSGKLLIQAASRFGFRAVNGGTARRTGGAWSQVIAIQKASFVSEFTVNLGMHFHDVPSVKSFSRVAAEDTILLDCVLRSRVTSFTGDGADMWFPSGLLTSSSGSDDLVMSCLAICDLAAEEFKSARSILEHVRVVSEDRIEFSDSLNRWLSVCSNAERLMSCALVCCSVPDCTFTKVLINAAASALSPVWRNAFLNSPDVRRALATEN